MLLSESVPRSVLYHSGSGRLGTLLGLLSSLSLLSSGLKDKQGPKRYRKGRESRMGRLRTGAGAGRLVISREWGLLHMVKLSADLLLNAKRHEDTKRLGGAVGKQCQQTLSLPIGLPVYRRSWLALYLFNLRVRARSVRPNIANYVFYLTISMSRTRKVVTHPMWELLMII
jgi:hypothetical protein